MRDSAREGSGAYNGVIKCMIAGIEVREGIDREIEVREGSDSESEFAEVEHEKTK